MSALQGRTLFIVNPAARRGHGRAAGERASEILALRIPGVDIDVVYTQYKDEGIKLGAESADYDQVIVLGGDGIVHEVVNGIMQLPKGSRPAFGVIPYGSGNDYARSLGMASDINQAISQLIDAKVRLLDVGKCNDQYFAETCSFGLDAAIGLATEGLRKKTKLSGTLLYGTAGAGQLVRHMDTYHFHASLDGGEVLSDAMIMFAVQVGPTYGGGFRICPDAKLDDGLFDIYYAQPAGFLKSSYIFLKARNAHHVSHTDVMHFYRAQELTISFDETPPCQLDGEGYQADSYTISTIPAALPVLMPA